MKKLYRTSMDPPSSSLPLCRTLDEATLLEALEERGVIEEVMTTLNLSGIRNSEKPDKKDEGRGTATERERREESLVSPRHLHPHLSSPDGKMTFIMHVCIY